MSRLQHYDTPEQMEYRRDNRSKLISLSDQLEQRTAVDYRVEYSRAGMAKELAEVNHSAGADTSNQAYENECDRRVH